jgi:hypothetical protein
MYHCPFTCFKHSADSKGDASGPGNGVALVSTTDLM